MTETAIAHGNRPGKRPRCAICRWRFDNACHKGAPMIISGMLAGGNGLVAIWPETPADSWCGDFAYRQEV